MSEKLVNDQQLKKMREQGLSVTEIAKKFGVSRRSVFRGFNRIEAPKSIEEEVADNEKRHEAQDMKSRYKKLLDKVSDLQRGMDAFKAVRQRKFSPIIKPIPSTGKNEATALVLATDWHVEEIVKSSSTNGRNEYNPRVAEARSNEFFVAVVKLLNKEAHQVRIPNIVLFLGGDFITGTLRDENLENCAMRGVPATMFAKRLLTSGLRYLLKETKCSITLVCAVGNHGRLTKKVHWSTETDNSLETFLYHALADEFKNENRMTWIIGEGYHTFLDIYDVKVRFHHGHAIRYLGGIGGLFVPALRAIAQWNRGGEVDLDVFGHHHTQVNGGNFLCNGSMIGYNAFAVSIKAPYEPPKQTFALIDAKRGLTTVTPIVFSL